MNLADSHFTTHVALVAMASIAAGPIHGVQRTTGVPYQGINVIMLWAASAAKGYSAPIWMTFKQALELNACVRKGEHGSLVVYASSVTRTETDESTGEEAERDIRFMKGYTVFNVEQIDGLPEHYYGKPAPRLDPVPRIAWADAFFAAIRADIRNGGGRAYYSVSTDHVQIPAFETFRDAEATTPPLPMNSRTGRSIHRALTATSGASAEANEGYAAEELVAELGAAFIYADLDLTPEVREDHASYIASWLKVLRNDKPAIFTAASHAQRAADYLHRLQEPAQAEAA